MRTILRHILAATLVPMLFVGIIATSPKTFAANSNLESKGDSQVEQTNVESNDSVKIYVKPEKVVPPKYKDGEQALYKIIGDNLKYPYEAGSQGIHGIVVIEAIIGLDGEVEEFKIQRSSKDESLDQEAMRVCKEYLTTGWIPANKNGEDIVGSYRLSFRFKI